MRRLIIEAIDRVSVEDARGNTHWFSLFDEVATIHLLKVLSGFGGATLFGQSQSRGTWRPIQVVAQVGNN